MMIKRSSIFVVLATLLIIANAAEENADSEDKIVQPSPVFVHKTEDESVKMSNNSSTILNNDEDKVTEQQPATNLTNEVPVQVIQSTEPSTKKPIQFIKLDRKSFANRHSRNEIFNTAKHHQMGYRNAKHRRNQNNVRFVDGHGSLRTANNWQTRFHKQPSNELRYYIPGNSNRYHDDDDYANDDDDDDEHLNHPRGYDDDDDYEDDDEDYEHPRNDEDDDEDDEDDDNHVRSYDEDDDDDDFIVTGTGTHNGESFQINKRNDIDDDDDYDDNDDIGRQGRQVDTSKRRNICRYGNVVVYMRGDCGPGSTNVNVIDLNSDNNGNNPSRPIEPLSNVNADKRQQQKRRRQQGLLNQNRPNGQAGNNNNNQNGQVGANNNKPNGQVGNNNNKNPNRHQVAFRQQKRKQQIQTKQDMAWRKRLRQQKKRMKRNQNRKRMNRMRRNHNGRGGGQYKRKRKLNRNSNYYNDNKRNQSKRRNRNLNKLHRRNNKRNRKY